VLSVLFLLNILLVFIYYYVTLVDCLLNVLLKGFRGICIQRYYLIFFYENVDFMFRYIFMYYDHGSKFICFRYFVPVEFLFIKIILVSCM